ncbi:MAG: hypothetical protein WC784_04525 [Candidatus Shapirobacteria bacterium]|jgi:hypothetical protein
MKHFARTSRALAIALFLSVAFAAGAQETGAGQDIEMDLDALFGDEVIESESATPVTTDPVSAALKSESVRIGGSFSGSLSTSMDWDNASDIFDPNTIGLSPSVRASLFFDGRPTEDFRVLGSIKTAWPFTTKKILAPGTVYLKDNNPYTDGDQPGNNIFNESISTSALSIFELFSDISLNDNVYVRFGKSTVKWGVGYFWSPADVINLSAIDVLDAGAQREGPVNVRVLIPMTGTQNNFYLYTILDENNIDFNTTALAGKAEFLISMYELGVGAYYRYDTAERGMVTFTGPLGDFDIFGEAIVSRGSAKTFATSIDAIAPYIHSQPSDETRETFYFSASTGFRYSDSNSNFSLVGQYYYNGEGYSKSEKDSLVNQGEATITVLNSINPTLAGALKGGLAGLIYGSGQHYVAMNLSKGKLFSDDLSIALTTVANLSDWSGFVRPSFNYVVHNNLSLNLSSNFVFGSSDSEYTYLAQGNLVSISLGATVSGSF